MQTKQEYENARRRARAGRRKVLVDNLLIQADALCDSQVKVNSEEVMQRMLRTLLELMKFERDSEARLDSFGTLLMECAWPDTYPGVVRDGNLIKIDGMFDLRKLARRMVWGAIADDLRTIGDENELDM